MNHYENFAHLWMKVAYRAIADEDCDEVSCYYKPSEISCDECKETAKVFNLVITSTLASTMKYDDDAFERELRERYQIKKGVK